jgi:hypothetical protein
MLKVGLPSLDMADHSITTPNSRPMSPNRVTMNAFVPARTAFGSL